jgi:NitT/TauT family transport system ATP-binding protein
MAAFLEISALSKSFAPRNGGGPSAALRDVDLKVAEGEFVCLVGPSGCGKSTLLNLVAGLEAPSNGSIRVAGREIAGAGAERGMVFQEAALFPWLNVVQNIGFPLKSLGVARAERRARALHYLRMVHLARFANAYVHELSGGMRQRVAIARALAMDPKILLMDEPFAALDAQTRDILHEELQQIWQDTRKTILFVTHNVREAAYLADRVAIFSAHPGTIKRVLAINYPHPRDKENMRIARAANVILEELKDEVEKAIRGQLGEEWQRPADRVSRSARLDLGRGI